MSRVHCFCVRKRSHCCCLRRCYHHLSVHCLVRTISLVGTLISNFPPCQSSAMANDIWRYTLSWYLLWSFLINCSQYQWYFYYSCFLLGLRSLLVLIPTCFFPASAASYSQCLFGLFMEDSKPVQPCPKPRLLAQMPSLSFLLSQNP